MMEGEPVTITKITFRKLTRSAEQTTLPRTVLAASTRQALSTCGSTTGSQHAQLVDITEEYDVSSVEPLGKRSARSTADSIATDRRGKT
eukprot:2030779-Pleurochrysis_carterae.AAC.1